MASLGRMLSAKRVGRYPNCCSESIKNSVDLEAARNVDFSGGNLFCESGLLRRLIILRGWSQKVLEYLTSHQSHK